MIFNINDKKIFNNILIGNKKLRLFREKEKLEDEIELQIIDLYEHNTKDENLYQIVLFGIDNKSNSYCVKINNFKPFFYIQIPSDYTYDKFLEIIKNIEIYDYNQLKEISKMDILFSYKKSKIFNGYHKNLTEFIKLSFDSLWDYYKIKKYFMNVENGTHQIKINDKLYNITLFEANISPMLRFLHKNDIKSGGWVKINNYMREYPNFYISNCQYEIDVDYKDVKPSDKVDIGKILIASYDIESVSQDGDFPQYKRKEDKVIQIGTTIEIYNETNSMLKCIFTLGECNDIKDSVVFCYKTEKDLLLGWANFMKSLDPDIITGYNILGFDYEYLYERARLYEIQKEFVCFSRFKTLINEKNINRLREQLYNLENSNRSGPKVYKKKQEILKKIETYDKKNDKILFQIKKLSSSAMGDNIFKTVNVTGRINLDLLKYCRDSGDKLDSYKLENVSKHYGLKQGKNDMPYHEIFRIYNKNGTPEEKTKVAEYCIQDCKLCNQLINKLNVIPNSIGMASTCFVPLQFLYTRGQSIKTYSLLIRETELLNYLIPVKLEREPGGYKGATVLSAKKGIHLYPVTALDFASLYPSSMISHNICISTKLREDQIKELHPTEYRKVEWVEELTSEDILKIMCNNKKICDEILNDRLYFHIKKLCTNDNKFRDINNIQKYIKNRIIKSKKSLEEMRLILIKLYRRDFYEFFELFNINIDNIKEKDFKDGNKVYKGLEIKKYHYYIQPKTLENGELDEEDRGVLPKILQTLLNKRNETKKLKAKYKKSDPFLSSIYDGLQLAYKLTCNSVYGQLGASTGNFSNMGVAASVTTTGRQLLELAQNFVLRHYEGSTAIYGDTDSIFVKFHLRRHKKSCIYHSDNKQKRIEKYHNIKNKIVEEMKITREEFLHSRKAKAMMVKSDFRLYEKCKCPEIKDLMSEEALKESIDLGTEVDALITELLPDRKRKLNGKKVGVQQLEYEKTYQPYILFSKKRYIGKLYEFETNQKDGWKLDYKGIVLKRRDNCPLLKKIYKECVMRIMDGNIDGSFNYLDKSLNQILNNHKLKKYPIKDFTLSKTLKGLNKYKSSCSKCKKSSQYIEIEIDGYLYNCSKCDKKIIHHKKSIKKCCDKKMKIKNKKILDYWCPICKENKLGNIRQPHVMLAQRQKQRDPGNAFNNNERVPYCFIENKNKNALQGDKVETPNYIIDNNLKLDYLYYIKNQLETPITQLLGFVDYERVKKIFQKHIILETNRRNGQKSIFNFLNMNSIKKELDFIDE